MNEVVEAVSTFKFIIFDEGVVVANINLASKDGQIQRRNIIINEKSHPSQLSEGLEDVTKLFPRSATHEVDDEQSRVRPRFGLMTTFLFTPEGRNDVTSRPNDVASSERRRTFSHGRSLEPTRL